VEHTVPKIVLSPKLLDGWRPGMQGGFRVNGNYSEAIVRAGGCPVLSLSGNAQMYAEMAEGLLLTGGIDLNPHLYGQEKLYGNVDTDDCLDVLELELFRAFMAAKKPIFGICRGIQLINVALGGSLWQDIPSQCAGAQKHKDSPSHRVMCEKDSIVGRLFGGEFSVNTFHHQSVRDAAPDLRVTARSADGLAEALEHVSLPIFAVQWHPERMNCAENGMPDMSPLFDYFISLCR